MRTLLFDGSLGSLGEDPADEWVPFRRAGTVVLLSTLLTARTATDPRGEFASRGECFDIRTDLGNYLLCGVGTESGNFSESNHRRLVVLHRLRDRKSTRLNSSHMSISYAVFCLKKKKKNKKKKNH